jgi:hypothetical protein
MLFLSNKRMIVAYFRKQIKKSTLWNNKFLIIISAVHVAGWRPGFWLSGHSLASGLFRVGLNCKYTLHTRSLCILHFRTINFHAGCLIAKDCMFSRQTQFLQKLGPSSAFQHTCIRPQIYQSISLVISCQLVQ